MMHTFGMDVKPNVYVAFGLGVGTALLSGWQIMVSAMRISGRLGAGLVTSN